MCFTCKKTEQSDLEGLKVWRNQLQTHNRQTLNLCFLVKLLTFSWSNLVIRHSMNWKQFLSTTDTNSSKLMSTVISKRLIKVSMAVSVEGNLCTTRSTKSARGGPMIPSSVQTSFHTVYYSEDQPLSRAAVCILYMARLKIIFPLTPARLHFPLSPWNFNLSSGPNDPIQPAPFCHCFHSLF